MGEAALTGLKQPKRDRALWQHILATPLELRLNARIANHFMHIPPS